MTQINWENIWLDLYGDADSIVNKRRLSEIGHLECYVSHQSKTGAKCFEVVFDELSLIKYQKSYSGLDIVLLEIGNGKKILTFNLLDEELFGVFILCLNDLVTIAENEGSDEEIFSNLAGRIDKWGKLFARLTGSVMSVERQRGLFGELTILQDLLEKNVQILDCVLAWTGPHGTNQDFSNKESAIEIKTSRATSPNINISSELQLDSTPFETLCLCVIHIDEINNGPHTLFKIISDIKEAIHANPESLNLFEEKLDRYGIPKDEEVNYKDLGFVIRSKNFFKVLEGFPAITGESLTNAAVHNVKYQIEISALEPFRTNEEDILSPFI